MWRDLVNFPPWYELLTGQPAFLKLKSTWKSPAVLYQTPGMMHGPCTSHKFSGHAVTAGSCTDKPLDNEQSCEGTAQDLVEIPVCWKHQKCSSPDGEMLWWETELTQQGSMWAANSRAVSAAQACNSSHHTMRTSYPKHGTIAFRSFPIECQSCLGPILTLWAFTTLFLEQKRFLCH